MKIKTKIIGAIMALSAIALTSCNKTIFDTQYTFNQAIVTLGDKIVVYRITAWKDYEGEQFQLELEDGSVIVTSSYNTILVYNNSAGTSKIIEDFKNGKS